MNLKELHHNSKDVSTSLLFKTIEGNVTSIQILANKKLKEHITKTPALLVCIEGKIIFENEKGIKEILMPGDYINIEPMVKHWVEGTIESQLLLIK